MLTSREAASLILLGGTVLTCLALPKPRRTLAPVLKNLLQAVFARPLVYAYALVIVVSTASTIVALRIGIWDPSMTKDAAIIALAVVLPMTFRSTNAKSGGALTAQVLGETAGLTALATFYLDIAPLSLFSELVLQPFVFLIVVMNSALERDKAHAHLGRAFGALQSLVDLALVVWVTVSLLSGDADWRSALHSLSFNLWLPLSLLPFFYVFGFYTRASAVRARFRSLRKPFTPGVFLAFLIGTRLRMRLLSKFCGRHDRVADANGFRDALRRMRDFREDVARRDNEEAERLSALRLNAGRVGLDSDGLHIDRREFHVTKDRLEWVWTCQNGQWDRQGGRYWDHLTDIIVDADANELPKDHGFTVQLAEGGQAWRSWRRTPGGAVLGIGGCGRYSKFLFQGDSPPSSFPGASAEWVDAGLAEWPPDWNKDDGTRL